MPIYDLGYRGWQGRLVPEAGRFWAITQTGVRLAWQARFLRRILLLAWAPTALFAVGFFAYEQFATRFERRVTRATEELLQFLLPGIDFRDDLSGALEERLGRAEARARQRPMPQAAGPPLGPPPDLQTRQPPLPVRGKAGSAQPRMVLGRIPPSGLGAAGTTPDSSSRRTAENLRIAKERHLVWSWLLANFFRYPQAVVMALLVGMIAPPLIAQDVRTRAFLLYFSRPLTRVEYMVGKMAVLWGYLSLITTLPALFLYLLGVFLSPDLGVIRETWDLPLRILAASAVLMIPTTALALALSSLTSESRYATFAWFAIWAAGWAAYAIVNVNIPGSRTAQNVTLASLYHILGEVQHWVFGLDRSFGSLVSAVVRVQPARLPVSAAAVELTAITLVSLAILYRRVSAPMRV
ncbi:MAG: ABC transporter permease [Thermoguttaceae bacterium]